MADSICRALRDGALEGEQAQALTIKDAIASPFASDAFHHFLAQLSSNIFAAKSQSRGLVLVAFARSPSFYLDLLKRRGLDVDSESSNKWIRILDCYSDPLGWKDGPSHEASIVATRCTDVKDLNKLYSMVIELGQDLVGQGKIRFSAVIDSVSEMLRRSTTSSVCSLLSNLRSHDQVSSLAWLLHSDLHEDRVTASLEYISTIVASVEPLNQYAKGQRNTLHSVDQSTTKAKFQVRSKRRNGRVRVACEEIQVEQSGVKFSTGLSEEGLANQGLIPKVQFNLQLSEKEVIDRANVVLPFEHQGTGKPLDIYDGRKPPSATTNEPDEASKGEIIYFRDSDDEMADSDEDPDDDLDI